MSKKSLLIGAGIIAAIAMAFFVYKGTRKDNKADFRRSQKGQFKLEIETTGELEAKNSVRFKSITVVTSGMWQLPFRMCVEGSVVKERRLGRYIGSVTVSRQIQPKQIELTKPF